MFSSQSQDLTTDFSLCRTAELLAAKLNQLRGDTVKTVMASQALNITVSSPQKVGKGLFSYITYR